MRLKQEVIEALRWAALHLDSDYDCEKYTRLYCRLEREWRPAPLFTREEIGAVKRAVELMTAEAGAAKLTSQPGSAEDQMADAMREILPDLKRIAEKMSAPSEKP